MDRGAWWVTVQGVAKSCTQMIELAYTRKVLEAKELWDAPSMDGLLIHASNTRKNKYIRILWPFVFPRMHSLL